MRATLEFQSASEIKAFQDQELKKLLGYLASSSPFYQKIFKEKSVDIEGIKGVDDLVKLPFTTKADLQVFNQEFLCVEPRKLIDYVTTSGTLGSPVTFALTDQDLERLAYNEAISLAATGIDENDMIQLTTTMDRRFMAGLAYFMGARKLGAGIVRVGAGVPALQWESIQRMKPSAIIAVPSFVCKLLEFAEEKGIDYQQIGVHKIVCIGEPIRNEDFSLNALGQRIKERWPEVELYSTYASTEMGAAFTECEQQHGGHLHPELLILEVLDENGVPVPEGESGEVVVTTLGVEGMPLLRFKTGDVCRVYYDDCSCGRKTPRLGPVLGRKGQMIKYKGTSIYPSQIYELLNTLELVENYIVQVSKDDLGLDSVLVRIGVGEEYQNSQALLEEFKDHFRAKLRVVPNFSLEDSKQILREQFPEMSRKPVMFVDQR